MSFFIYIMPYKLDCLTCSQRIEHILVEKWTRLECKSCKSTPSVINIKKGMNIIEYRLLAGLINCNRRLQLKIKENRIVVNNFSVEKLFSTLLRKLRMRAITIGILRKKYGNSVINIFDFIDYRLFN